MICTLYFDGASRGNPGPAGAGAHITIGRNNIELAKSLGKMTNNQAEYNALILGLQYIQEVLVPQFDTFELNIKGDSNLVIQQIQGYWKISSDLLKPLHGKVVILLRTLQEKNIKWFATHIRRELNKKADALANRVLD